MKTNTDMLIKFLLKVEQMKLLILIQIIILSFIVPQEAKAKVCQNYLEKSRSLTIISNQSTGLTKLEHDLKGNPKKEKIRAALIKDEIIYSPFFYSFFVQRTIDYRNNIYAGFTSTQIALMSVDETYEIALDVYKKMKITFTTPTTPQLNLKSASNSKDMFFSIPEEIIVHFMHESIMAYGIEGQFNELVTKEADAKMGIVLGPSSLVGVGSLALYVLGVDNFILSSELLGSAGLIGSGITVSLMAAGPKIHNFFKKQKLKSTVNKVARRKFAEDNTQLMIKKSNGHKLTEDLKEIERRLAEVHFNETNQLLTYGSEALGLHRDLIQSFVADFSRWMNIYGQNSDAIKSKLVELKKGEITIGQLDSNLISFTGHVFVEAAQATKKTVATSVLILEKLNEALKILNEIDHTQLSPTDKLDFARKSETLRNAIIIHSHFLEYLTNVYQTIAKVLEGVDRLLIAESGAMVKVISDRLGSEINILSDLDQLINDLDRMESYRKDIAIK